jgi:hypothetical protein
MTNDEMDKVIDLMMADSMGAGLKAFTALSTEERAEVKARMQERSEEATKKAQQAIREATANPKLQELYAQDQAKKKRKKRI